jgi:cyclopropane-fatty-acyl-phospholipid synthase
MNEIAKTTEYDCPKRGAFDRFLRQQPLSQLKSLRHGRLLLADDGGQLEFGQAAATSDLGNEFFALFLSSDLMYSSAIWTEESDTLETASTRKLERICRKLDLKSADRVLEIGTGWGGFALYAAWHHGCHVTTTTLSREQHALAGKRVLAEGWGAHVELPLEDYRDLRRQYDKLELVQVITIEDHRYAQALKSVDYIMRHVFPGSFISSINAHFVSKTRASDLALVQMEDFGCSYALTLKAWRESFMARLLLAKPGNRRPGPPAEIERAERNLK